MKIALRILGIISLILGLLVLIVSPSGVVGIILGVLCLIKSNQKLNDKIAAYLKQGKEKTDQRYDILKGKITEYEQKLKDITSNESKNDIEEEIEAMKKENEEFDIYFEKWIKLREEYQQAKKENDYQKIIDVANLIKNLDSEYKEIGIFIPIFDKDIAEAYIKLGLKDKAIFYYKVALSGFKTEHEKNKSKQSKSWLKDIGIIEKKLVKLTE